MPAIIQGGGVTPHDGVHTYIDLIVHSFENLEEEYPQSSSLFRSFAKFKQGTANFGYAEIGNDKRLIEKLSTSNAGLLFYKKLEAALPVITVSDRILGDINNVENVLFFELVQFEKNPLLVLDEIAKASKLKTQAETNAFIDKIEKLNKIFSLKPGLFGLSININALVDDWINRQRKGGII